MISDTIGKYVCKGSAGLHTDRRLAITIPRKKEKKLHIYKQPYFCPIYTIGLFLKGRKGKILLSTIQFFCFIKGK